MVRQPYHRGGRQRALAAILVVGAGLLALALAGRAGAPVLLFQPVHPLLVDMFPPTPPWGTTPGSVGQVGNGETPAKGQEINVLGGGYQFPDYARQQGAVMAMAFGQPASLAWQTTPNSVGSVGSGEEPAPGQDINVLGGDYVFPSYVRSVQFPDYARQQGAVMAMAFGQPASLAWQTTPNSVGSVGSGEEPAPGQDINVLGGDYVFPSYVRSGVRTGRLGRPAVLIPRAAKLWGGQYSSVGEFPKGYNGQRSYGGEWNVWALPTEEQMEESAECDPSEPCIDGPLASIGERNVLDGLGNDPDSPVWREDAGDQPAGTTGNCCGSALGEAGGFEEPSHAWLSA